MEQPKNSSEQEKKSLSIIDFGRPPEVLQEFRVGDPLTRENFVSFIIQSFAISRGRPEAQWLFFEWLMDKNDQYAGLSETLKAFVVKGGWEILSSAEKEQFLSAFRMVKKHEKWLDFEHEDEIKQELEALNQEVRPTYTAPIRSTLHLTSDLTEIESLADLKAKIGEYMKIIRPQNLK